MAKTKKPARKPRPKQKYLNDDMAPPSFKDVDGAAESYYEAMQARLPYTKEEAEAKKTLINKMIEHGLTRYQDAEAGLDVILTDSKNVKVKPKKDAEPSENGEAE